MAAVEVTISGVLYDKTARTMRPVVLIGEASLTGLGVGGGPMPGDPPVIWGGPIDPRPDHGLPGRPPGTWGGSGEPFPGWGLPEPPGGGAPPPDMSPGGEKPPPEGAAGWGYYDNRWGWFPAPGQAQPKS